MEDLRNTTKQGELFSIHIIFHPRTTECAFFPDAH